MNVMVKVYKLGREMHPGISLSGIKHRIMLTLRALLSFATVSQWYSNSGNPLLMRTLDRYPMISGAIYWPYINHAWTMEQRLAAIDRHYHMLDGAASIIARASFQPVELARMDEEYAGLRIVLDKAPWFIREGEIVINLFINDERFYSLAFTLGCQNGKNIAYVGAIQGSNTEAAQAIYRDITHALHGMRPRDFLVTAFKMLCNSMQIETIWAVTNEFRQHNSSYFGGTHKEKVLVAYNEIWQEHGGSELGNGFYEIPAQVRRRTIEEIPARKRANYRRRYEMLDRLEARINSGCLSTPEAPAAAGMAEQPVEAHTT